MKIQSKIEIIRHEVEEIVRERGRISKDEIKAMWDITESDYDNLRKWFERRPGIDPGPQGVGGFRLRAISVRKTPPNLVASEEVASHETSITVAPWEQDVANRLTELFDTKELECFVKDLLSNALRLTRKRATGQDRHNNKQELARAIVIKHGLDLLSDKEIRHAIGGKCKISAPQKWHPGKEAALTFVHQIGFPSNLAGVPSDDAPEDYEYLEGRLDVMALQDFQEEVKQKLLYHMNSRNGRAVVVLPTGAGKTRVAVESIRDWLTSRHRSQSKVDTVLWLAHSAELCDQAYNEFSQLWQASANVCPLLLVRFYGRFTDVHEHKHILQDILIRSSVLVSTPQRLLNLLESESEGVRSVKMDIVGRLSLVAIDEAHRAAAPIYRNILRHLSIDQVDAPVIGLTATPFRAEYADDAEAGTKELKEIFQNLIEPCKTLGDDARATLQQREILAEPRIETIQTSTVLKSPIDIKANTEVTDEDIERIDRAMSIKADNPTRRLLVFNRIVEHCKNPSSAILYFGPTVADAECMAFLLRNNGLSAACVSGKTRDASRRQCVRHFKAGQIQVLCNCEVLTTGFDVPRVTHVVVARPTVSKVLYEQMVGRGLRGPKFGGTKECIIVDCKDIYRSERPRLGYQEFRHIWRPRDLVE